MDPKMGNLMLENQQFKSDDDKKPVEFVFFRLDFHTNLTSNSLEAHTQGKLPYLSMWFLAISEFWCWGNMVSNGMSQYPKMAPVPVGDSFQFIQISQTATKAEVATWALSSNPTIEACLNPHDDKTWWHSPQNAWPFSIQWVCLNGCPKTQWI